MAAPAPSPQATAAAKGASPPPMSATRPPEQQLAPGVYFTPAPRSSGSLEQQLPPAPRVEDMTRDELEFEYRSISKSVDKLTESNQLMRDFDPTGADLVMVDAIRENTAIIVRLRMRLVSVKARIEVLMRREPPPKAAAAAAPPPAQAEGTPSGMMDAAAAEAQAPGDDEQGASNSLAGGMDL